MADSSAATTTGRTGSGAEETDGGIVIERHDNNAVSCRWTLPGFSQLSKQRTSTGWLAVGAGQDCRLLIYPGGRCPASAPDKFLNASASRASAVLVDLCVALPFTVGGTLEEPNFFVRPTALPVMHDIYLFCKFP